MKTSLSICVIPCAGLGTRWAPLSNFIPKEMLPFENRPVIEWGVKEAAESGFQKVILVISKRKKVIKDYLMEHKKIYPKIELHFVYQDKPSGIVDAILKARKIIKNEAFAVLFPDTPSIYKIPPLKQMKEVFDLMGDDTYVLPFAKYPKYNLLSYGECLLKKRKDGLFDVVHICPHLNTISKSHHKGNKFRLGGREIFPRGSMKVFQKISNEKKDKYAHDGDILSYAIEDNQKVIGFKVDATIFEVGNVNSYMESYLKLNKIKNSKLYLK